MLLLYMLPGDLSMFTGPKPVQVQWHDQPEGYVQTVPLTPQTAHDDYRIFPLNYVACPGDPVTVMIARKGLRVTRRRPTLRELLQPGKRAAALAELYAEAASAPASGVGTLVQPMRQEGTTAWWKVDWGGDKEKGCSRVGATHVDQCDLQVGGVK